MPHYDEAIRVQDLNKHFNGIAAVKDVNFTLNRGQTLALLGANGAGKTTTISMLMGLLLPTSGQITVLGGDMLRHRYRLLQRMNFSSPYVDLPRRLSVRQNLMFFARLYGCPDPKARLEELAHDLDLGPLWRKPTGKLSSGQKTRVSLAKALINAPEILLLDEPTASLDPDTADWLRGYLQDYQQRSSTAILLASHNMSEVERLAHQVRIMRAGEIVETGTPRELLDRHGRGNLEQVFLDIARNQRQPDGAYGEAAS
ncbi:ABC transporter ATP-binding protein [Fodinicurvata sediminis]|uniref:ABC transporter ATP-binding protein n=1 Tax=Fodinicurvata sediminis TaxID=1121832 RepID=UPI0003B76CDA|nr:ABC transporter ATP-binding protein [Fodinicurvata sediminis]